MAPVSKRRKFQREAVKSATAGAAAARARRRNGEPTPPPPPIDMTHLASPTPSIVDLDTPPLSPSTSVTDPPLSPSTSVIDPSLPSGVTSPLPFGVVDNASSVDAYTTSNDLAENEDGSKSQPELEVEPASSPASFGTSQAAPSNAFSILTSNAARVNWVEADKGIGGKKSKYNGSSESTAFRNKRKAKKEAQELQTGGQRPLTGMVELIPTHSSSNSAASAPPTWDPTIPEPPILSASVRRRNEQRKLALEKHRDDLTHIIQHWKLRDFSINEEKRLGPGAQFYEGKLQRDRAQTLRGFYNRLIIGGTRQMASEQEAIANNLGQTNGSRSIRRWARDFEETGELPTSGKGKGPKPKLSA